MNPDVLVTDFYCERCGHRPGKWWVDGKPVPLPVPEETSFIRVVLATAVHDAIDGVPDTCGGRLLIATEPLEDA